MAEANDINRGVAAMETGGARAPSSSMSASAQGSSVESKAENFFEFRHVCKSFDDNVVLKDVSFSVKRAETCVIMGRSGVGKSVSLKHIMGFMKADSGRIFVDRVDVTDFSEQQFEEVRRKVTMVFQSGALFDSLTVAENIAFPLEKQPGLENEDIDAYVAKLAMMLEVEEVLDKLPSELSTGMKRAVAMARAFAQNPDAILFDEPTTMVDPIMAGHMGDLILRLKDAFHRTSIVVTHDTHLAKKLADTVVFLQDSRVGFFGPWDDFENSKDPFLHNFRMQDALIPALDVTL
jgi:phospholipid/cholesterol/gamma-HCH transport system ATP-binding protein